MSHNALDGDEEVNSGIRVEILEYLSILLHKTVRINGVRSTRV